jgi:phosphoribosyl-AMP cyclohydrolase
MKTPEWLDQVKFDAQGLVTAVTQDAFDGSVLMLAHMNREALEETLRSRRAVYWSRSRGSLWRKGEKSGNVQHVVAVFLDCDMDAVLVKVRQDGGAACHTGRRSCFFHAASEGGVEIIGEPVFDPEKVYKK